MITQYYQALPIMAEFMENQDLPQEVKESWDMINSYMEMSGIVEASKEWEATNAE
jgi:hypothetical protein|tara:strand:- start:632 stop:796 length:165 start_codon:yes stop_codon:yes gene_type:complete